MNSPVKDRKTVDPILIFAFLLTNASTLGNCLK